MDVYKFPILNPSPTSLPLGHPSTPAPSILYHASNLDWQFISYMILYMFQCHSPKSSHPLPLPQSPHILSLLLSRIQGYHCHLSKFHIYALVYCIGVFSFWVASCCIIGSSFIHLIRTDGWVILHCVYVPQLSYPFFCWWASRLLPCPGYYKQCCDEHWGTNVSCSSGFLTVYAQKWDCSVIRQFYFQFLKESPHCSP